MFLTGPMRLLRGPAAGEGPTRIVSAQLGGSHALRLASSTLELYLARIHGRLRGGLALSLRLACFALRASHCSTGFHAALFAARRAIRACARMRALRLMPSRVSVPLKAYQMPVCLHN